MADGRKNNGAKKGENRGQGRKPKRDEEKLNNLFVEAVKQITKKDNEDDARIAFIKRIAQHERGEMFIAQHLFGKPKESVDLSLNNKISLKDLVSFE